MSVVQKCFNCLAPVLPEQANTLPAEHGHIHACQRCVTVVLADGVRRGS